MTDDNGIGSVLQTWLSDIPRDGLRARIDAKRRTRRRRRIFAAGGASLVLAVTLGGTAATLTGRDEGSVLAGRGEQRPGVDCVPLWTQLTPSWLPLGWSTEPDRTGHRWSGPSGASFDVAGREPSVALANSERISVIGRPGRIGDVGERTSIVVPADAGGRAEISAIGACAITVTANAVSRDDVIGIAEGLVLDDQAFAMWPYTTPADAVRASQADIDDPGASDPATVAERFAAEVLDWDDVTSTLYDTTGSTDVISAANGPVGAVDASVVAVTDAATGTTAKVLLREGPRGTWCVYSMSTLAKGESVSLTVTREDPGAGKGGSVRVDLPADLNAARGKISFFSGGVGASDQSSGSGSLGVSWDGDEWDPRQPGSVVVQLLDEGDETVAAWGTAVPAGDYGASYDVFVRDSDDDGTVEDQRRQRERDRRADASAAAARRAGTHGTWTQTNEQGDTITGSTLWYSAGDDLSPGSDELTQVFAAGTWLMLGRDEPRCGVYPGAAIAALRPIDAFLIIYEDVGAGAAAELPDRPATFEQEMSNEDGSSDCAPDKSFEHDWIPFRVGGRAFYLYVAKGSDATADTIATLWQTADTFATR